MCHLFIPLPDLWSRWHCGVTELPGLSGLSRGSVPTRDPWQEHRDVREQELAQGRDWHGDVLVKELAQGRNWHRDVVQELARGFLGAGIGTGMLWCRIAPCCALCQTRTSTAREGHRVPSMVL